jgi:hypothetical protein
VDHETPEERLRRLPANYFDHPSPARVWNYWSGGKDNYPVDREVGDLVSSMYPGILAMAGQAREFLIRTVGFLAAEVGIRQFLDLGCGLPARCNTHDVAQAARPDARVVYVDNDPVVAAHARALLTSSSTEGATAFWDADYRDTGQVIAGARQTLSFDEPIAVMFMGVFGYQPDYAEMRSTVSRTIDATLPGSYLVLWDGTDTSEAARASHVEQAKKGHAYQLRTIEQIQQCFQGLEVLPPGVVPIPLWRPGPTELGTPPDVDAYGAVAHKV